MGCGMHTQCKDAAILDYTVPPSITTPHTVAWPYAYAARMPSGCRSILPAPARDDLAVRQDIGLRLE